MLASGDRHHQEAVAMMDDGRLSMRHAVILDLLCSWDRFVSFKRIPASGEIDTRYQVTLREPDVRLVGYHPGVVLLNASRELTKAPI